MRFLFGMSGLLATLAFAGCMKVSDMAEGTRYHLRDAGILDIDERVRLQPPGAGTTCLAMIETAGVAQVIAGALGHVADLHPARECEYRQQA